MMILVLNFFIKDEFADTFNQAIEEHLKETSNDCNFVRVGKNTKAKDLLDEYESATHLILSGSEASTLDDMGWEEEIKGVIQYFMYKNKPILGICYGHQFLVRSLAGKQHLRKALKPEMGWGKINLVENEFFKGIENPVCLLAHYDEAFDLPSEFKILGFSERCDVHGFQYKNLPVWGLQFHPEYNLQSGSEILDNLEENDPLYSEHYVSNLENEHQLKQNRKIFINFASS